MMLFLAILILIIALGSAVLIAFANGMSDAPDGPGTSFAPAGLALLISVALWICWWFGWHPSW